MTEQPVIAALHKRDKALLQNVRFYLIALKACYVMRWKEGLRISEVLLPLGMALGPSVAIGWVVGQSGNETAIAYIFVGAALSQMWNFAIWRIGWQLTGEFYAGTMELQLTTRTPVMLVLMGKSLAILTLQLPSAVLAFTIVLLFSGGFYSVHNVPLLFISVLIAIGSLVASAFLFAPFVLLNGARGGFFNVFVPVGIVLSGFLYPIELLPPVMEALARLIPTSWAMEAVIGSVVGAPTSEIVTDWAIAVALTAAFIMGANVLFEIAERRVRKVGNLNSG